VEGIEFKRREEFCIAKLKTFYFFFSLQKNKTLSRVSLSLSRFWVFGFLLAWLFTSLSGVWKWRGKEKNHNQNH